MLKKIGKIILGGVIGGTLPITPDPKMPDSFEEILAMSVGSLLGILLTYIRSPKDETKVRRNSII